MRRVKQFGIAIAALLILVAASFTFSPWPSVLLIRAIFNADAVSRNEALSLRAKPTVADMRNIPYGEAAKETLNVFHQPGLGPKPAIVWIHGGAFIAGRKEDLSGYLKILAGENYTAIAVGYSIAPEVKYPVPLVQIQQALEYIVANAVRLDVDPNRIYLAGDSAGAQLATQTALLIVDPVYASMTGIKPRLAPQHLKGVILWCGVYDPRLGDGTGMVGAFVRTVMWSYFGEKEPAVDNKDLSDFSVIDHVSGKLPPVFISVGNADPLESQSRALANRLKEKGVKTETLFFEENHQAELGHEYQFDLSLGDSKTAYARLLEFLNTN